MAEGIGLPALLPKCSVGDVRVNGVVDHGDEGREVHVKTIIVGDESATQHPAMSSEGVERKA